MKYGISNKKGNKSVYCKAPKTLYIYEEKSMIVLVETKDFSMSKNFYEIYNEYTRMFDKTNPKSFINKGLIVFIFNKMLVGSF